ncbi:hypothetical protein [Tautonia sociabilis]|uniref:Uncharacterized protein n=1 Tax=Tautonia sociabilis TaxID=2080755 RepID=A0A432ML58_9BACT|nr:hypothetical protein [Tautonia sociabilis]RUL88142.1 hypothetical protein TsocGM_08355 [Tautonia sociabilis]
MRRQAVISMPLSFAIVLLAAVVLVGDGRIGPASESAAAGSRPGPGTLPPEIGPKAAQESPAPAPALVPVPAPGLPPAPDLGPVGPAFVDSAPGESLEDLALRVFGSVEMAGPLQTANPGLVIEPWRALPAGTRLRLP